jgi:putative endonuclease
MKQSQKQSDKNKTGSYGEEITATWLMKHGFSIIEQNYLKKWGEIDVVAKKEGKIHFVEVKTVSYETKQALKKAVSYGTWRPEENAHPQKLQKVARTAETWCLERNWEGEWQIDVAAVRIVPRETYATIKFIENVII